MRQESGITGRGGFKSLVASERKKTTVIAKNSLTLTPNKQASTDNQRKLTFHQPTAEQQNA